MDPPTRGDRIRLKVSCGLFRALHVRVIRSVDHGYIQGQTIVHVVFDGELVA